MCCSHSSRIKKNVWILSGIRFLLRVINVIKTIMRWSPLMFEWVDAIFYACSWNCQLKLMNHWGPEMTGKVEKRWISLAVKHKMKLEQIIPESWIPCKERRLENVFHQTHIISSAAVLQGKRSLWSYFDEQVSINDVVYLPPTPSANSFNTSIHNVQRRVVSPLQWEHQPRKHHYDGILYIYIHTMMEIENKLNFFLINNKYFIILLLITKLISILHSLMAFNSKENFNMYFIFERMYKAAFIIIPIIKWDGKLSHHKWSLERIIIVIV